MATLMEQKLTMATVTYFSLVEQEILIHLMNLGINFRKKKKADQAVKEKRNKWPDEKEETLESQKEGITSSLRQADVGVTCTDHNRRTETKSAYNEKN